MNAIIAPEFQCNLEGRVRELLPAQARHHSSNQRLLDGGLDSMDVVDLLCALDEDFQVRLTTDEFNEDTTIADLVRLVSEKLT